MTDRRLTDDGTSVLASSIDELDAVLPLSDAQWTTDSANYPLRLRVGGELMIATGVVTNGTQTFTGVVRSVNGVRKSHAAGTPVQVADGLRLTVGHALSPPTPITGEPPPTPDPTPTPEVPTTDLVLWIDAGQDPTAGNLDDDPYTAELGSTAGADAQDPAVTVAGSVDVWTPDGSDDHIDTDYTPTFTATAGAATFVFIGVWDSDDGAENFQRALSSESASSDGINISFDETGSAGLFTTVGGATTISFRFYRPADGLALVDGERFMVAATIDAGALRLYEPGLGLSAPADTTGVGTITHGPVRFFRPAADGIADRACSSSMQAGLIYERALSGVELDSIALAYGLIGSGGGGGNPGEFRAQQALATPGTPEHVLTALGHTDTAPITRAQLDGILDDWVTGTGGTTHNVTDSTSWNTARAAAVPGDLIRVTSTFDPTGDQVSLRGNRYGITGTNLAASPAGGSEGLPIICTCADGVWIDANNTASNTALLDLQNCAHVWAVGMNVRDGQFGIRCMNWGGTAGFPAYVAYCAVENTGHSGLICQGWFQLITSSPGGTPPAGAGNEWGFSQYFVLEENTVDGVGVIADQFGEAIYLGRGSAPGWVSYAKDGWVRGNRLVDWKADGIDCKPGCHRIRFTDNEIHTGHAVFGSPMGMLYVDASIDDRPAAFDFDPEIYVEGNRVYDSDLTNPHASSVHIMGYIGLSGVRIANNVMWAKPETGTHAMWRARNEKGTDAATALAEFRNDPTWIVNNTLWGDDTFENAGYGNPFVGPFPVSITFDLRNNICDQASPATGEVDAAASDFVGTVPAIGVAGTADAGDGAGSGFELDPASSLIGAGVSISDLALAINADILDRPIPASSPNPGAFQDA